MWVVFILICKFDVFIKKVGDDEKIFVWVGKLVLLILILVVFDWNSLYFVVISVEGNDVMICFL